MKLNLRLEVVQSLLLDEGITHRTKLTTLSVR